MPRPESHPVIRQYKAAETAVIAAIKTENHTVNLGLPSCGVAVLSDSLPISSSSVFSLQVGIQFLIIIRFKGRFVKVPFEQINFPLSFSICR